MNYHTITRRFTHNLQKYLVLYVLLHVCGCVVYSQYQSNNNHSGNWLEPESWSNTVTPGISVNGDSVIINGEIFSNECLDFNRSILTISDTLVINGNLTLKNTCSLNIETGGILIVLGDYLSNNQVDVSNNGIILIAGGFEMLGSDNQGSYFNKGKTFLFDPDPLIKKGTEYESLYCSIVADDTICGYLTRQNYQLDPLRAYVEGLPYDINTVSPIENSCTEISILISKTEICQFTDIQISAAMKGFSEADSLFWIFGTNASPSSAYGIGPHSVRYTTSGIKTITLNYLLDAAIYSDTSIQVFETPGDVNQVVGTTFNVNKPEFAESLCTGESSILHVEGDTNIQYFWQIPSIETEKFGTKIEIDWNGLTGIQSVYVNIISINDCHGEQTEVKVNIEDCPKENIFNNDTYAFTPNFDGYNDYWVVDDIKSYPLAQIRVYDKTGILVYESKGHYNNNWDGTHQGYVLPIDSYYFIIDLSAYEKDPIRGIVTILHD